MVQATSAEKSTHAGIPLKSDTWVYVPEDSRKPKPFFHGRPSLELILAIKHRIRVTREPWLDPNHTHTKPPRDSRPVYLGEFDLPRGYLTPCPCCSPNNFKFGSGKIAWFPDEHVLRLIGPQCFRTLNAELHDAALAQWEKEKKETQARDYLLERRDLVEIWLLVTDDLIAMARAADRFFPALINMLENRAGVPLYSAIRDGFLHVWEEQLEFVTNDKGETYTKMVNKLAIYNAVAGEHALKPNRKQLEVMLSQARTALSQAGAFSEEYIKSASVEDKSRIAKMMRIALTSIKHCRGMLETDCHFLRIENLQNVRGWASRPNARLQFELGIGDGRITVTKDGQTHSIIIPDALRVRVPPAFDTP